MGQSAKVTSVDALRDFREVLFKFCERVRDGLCATQMESRRVVDRLLNELPGYWRQQVHERQEEVAQAQTEWHRIKLMRAQDYKVDEVGPKKALERAKVRLEEAEEKVEKVRQWGRVAQRAVEEYEGRAHTLADLVEGNPPPSVVFLDRAIASLDAYLKVAPPVGGAETPVSSSAAAAPSTATTPTQRAAASQSGG
jgi:hypothetical protein